MKKILIILILPFLFLTTGCGYRENVEIQEVKVEIIDANYEPSRVQMIMSNKTLIPITHPAEYNITLSYNNKKYVINDEMAYNNYKNKIGICVDATMKVKTLNLFGLILKEHNFILD
jgi:hypothetical protein